MSDCRKKYCVEHQVMAIRGGRCRCIETVEKVDSAGVKPCKDMPEDSWKIYVLTSRIHPEASSFELIIRLMDAKGEARSMFAPNEPVVFDIHAVSVSKTGARTTIKKPLYVLVEFVDSGQQMYLNSLRFNRTWAQEGTFKVKFTIVTDLGSSTNSTQVQVSNSKLKPVKFKEVTLTSWLTPGKTNQVSLLGYAASKGHKTCSLKDQLGKVLKTIDSAEYVLSIGVETEVASFGSFRFVLECSNKHSTEKKETLILVPRTKSHTFHLREEQPAIISLQNAKSYEKRLTAVTDTGTTLPVSFDVPNQVKVDLSKVTDDHFSILLQLDNQFLSRDFVNVYHEPVVSSSTNSSSGLPNVTYDVRYKIVGKGIYDVNIFDVIFKKTYYLRTKFISTSVVIPQQYTFNATGAFMLNMRACSGGALYCDRTQLRINSDIPVMKVRLAAPKIDSIAAKNFLSLFINEGTSMPIINCSYTVKVAGVVVHTAQLENPNALFGPFKLPLKLRHYGRQRVTVYAENNLGSANASVMVTAGQLLSGLSVKPTDMMNAEVGADMAFTLTLKQGAPVAFSVDLGDKTVLQLPPVNPYDYTSTVSLPLFGNGGHGATRQLALQRSPQFSVSWGSLEVSGPRRPMTLKLQFGRRGVYSLAFAAKNIFNHLSTGICQVAFVEAKGLPKCDFSLTLAVEDNENVSSIKNEYSKALNIRPVVKSECLTNTDFRYQWEIFRKSPKDLHRVFCSEVSAVGLQQITVPENDLPYGTYEIRVRAAADKNLVMTDSKKLEVESVRSKLVASIKKEPAGDAEMLSSVVIDFLSSGDPDNDLDVTFDLLCFPKDDNVTKVTANNPDFVMRANSTSADGSEDSLIRVLDYKGRCFIEQSVISILNTGSNRTVSFMGSNMGSEDKQVIFRLIVRDSLERMASADLNLKLLATTDLTNAMKNRLDEMLNTKDQAALLKFVSSASTQLVSRDVKTLHSLSPRNELAFPSRITPSRTPAK